MASARPQDQWTKYQQHYLANPMSQGLGTMLFGSDIAAMGYPTREFAADPYLYQGPYAAPTSPLQQQAYGMAPGVAQQQMAALGGIANGQGPMDAMYQYGQRYANDVLTPNVMERFAGMGTADSGGAMRGLTRELGTYGLGLNAQIGQMGMQNQAQQMQAAQMMGQVPQTLGLMGAQQQQAQQQQIEGQIQRSQALHPMNAPAMQVGMNMLGLNNPAAVGQQDQGFGSSFMSGFAPALGTLGAFALLSDKRAKENIVPVDGVLAKLRNLKVHTYNYKGDDSPRMGLIAQDLEKEFPDAVIDKDGLKHVDLYALQSIIVAAISELSEVA